MKITVTHARAFAGSNITVIVEADPKESIRSVETVLDGDTLEQADLAPGTERYQREFSCVGQAAPGDDHTLAVTAEDKDGAPHTSITRWTDAI